MNPPDPTIPPAPTIPIVRFAPSPTGHLHIGGVRTALFNYLYAKNLKGRLILRIEDTDMSRSSKEMAEEILKGLLWMGIHWDEGPVYQSDHFPRYKEIALKLLAEGKAYRCFCTPEEIEARRQASQTLDKSEQIYKYDRSCLALTPAQIEEKLTQNTGFVIRFRIPDGTTFFKDRLHKDMQTENSQLEDFVILKSDDSPTYHLSVVADDSDMGITDVIRGDDHISNTFKQVLLFRALEQKPPKYTHLPLILGPDKKKLSKRHGETSVLEFKRQGYLAEAVVNYLAQLSWLPADTKTIFPMDELVKRFKLSSLSKNSPVFDYDKLRFLNSRAIQEKSAPELLELLKENYEFMQNYSNRDVGNIEKQQALIDLVKPRMKTLDQFEQKFAIYLAGELNYANDDLEKLKETYTNEDITNSLRFLAAELETLETVGSDDFSAAVVEEKLRECAGQKGLKAGDMIHAARFALTSETVSPSIFDVFAFLGKEESIRRMNRLIEFLAH